MNRPPLPWQFRTRTIMGKHYVMALFHGQDAIRWAGPYSCPHAAELARKRHSELNRITREYRETPAPDAARTQPKGCE